MAVSFSDNPIILTIYNKKKIHIVFFFKKYYMKKLNYFSVFGKTKLRRIAVIPEVVIAELKTV